MRILIAEDDQVLADGLLRSLRASGAVVDHVANGAEADTALVTHNHFDLLILDLGLPRIHGLEVLRRLRSRGDSLPVLILTAADAVEERVKGLDLGADDYMAKPFSLQELEARVRALARRGMGNSTSTIKHGPLTYDQAGRVATIDGKMVELSARELGLLEVLLQRAGRLVSKEQLVERLCEWGEEVSNNAIEVYIRRLRKRLKKAPSVSPRCGAWGIAWKKFRVDQWWCPWPPCTWRWAISSAVAARTSVTLAVKRRALPARGWLPSSSTTGPLIFTTLYTCGSPWSLLPRSWPPTFTPGGKSPLGMVRLRLLSMAPKASSTARSTVTLSPTVLSARAASTFGKIFSYPPCR